MMLMVTTVVLIEPQPPPTFSEGRMTRDFRIGTLNSALHIIDEDDDDYYSNCNDITEDTFMSQ